ncbi:DNA mismatch repair protein MutS [Flagelloscypha sp. PMI_526]|nr:DNA mismatch repair protein MutS [Flagelloscypha sp. PMI_526]
MAASCIHGKLGCAFYDPMKCVIYVLEDTQEFKYFDLTKMLLEQVAPDILLTSSRADEEFIDILRDHCDTAGGDFQIRPYKEFFPSKGRDRLMMLNLLSELPDDPVDYHLPSSIPGASEPRDAYSFMAQRKELNGDPTMKRWNASVRLKNFVGVESSPQCMASIGALLDCLVRENAVSDLEDEGISGLDVMDIESLSLNKVMQINADALSSLQIFEAESHASVHSDKTKEGLSLFGILNTTKTTLGKALLRTWFLRPSLDPNVINARHDALDCFMDPANSTTITGVHGHLKGIKNIPRTLTMLRNGRAKLGDWQALVKFTFHATMIRDAVCELHQAKDVEIVHKLLAGLDVSAFRDTGTKINDIIDWEESTIAGRVCIRPHIDEELDNRKHIYHGIDSVLSKVAQQICYTVPTDFAESLNVVYFPQLGFLVCVPMLNQWQGGSNIQVLEGWTFQFSSESHVYFKNQEMHDMDLHIGDLHSSIVDREIEIIQELLLDVMKVDKAIVRACDICAELDCLLSLANASIAYNYRRPKIVDEDVIEIVQGRHPLQEQAADSFVSNDARIGGVHPASAERSEGDEEWSAGDVLGNRVVICTGANACGKSVFLKQVALIQFMAQIGCFVPAESSRLGIVDKIFTRVSTRESVSTVQSAFMIDLNQVSLALRNSTFRSLVLLDEFGKGTLPTDGAGLFCGIIHHFLSRGADCPKVLAATHFHDVFRDDLLAVDSSRISFLHMQVMFSGIDEAPQNEGTSDSISRVSTSQEPAQSREAITYLYRVAEGLSLDSRAAQCAEIFGIPSRIVDRAQYVSFLLSTHELGRLLDEDMTKKEKDELEEAEEVCRRFLAWDLNGVAQEKDAKEMLQTILYFNEATNNE